MPSIGSGIGASRPVLLAFSWQLTRQLTRQLTGKLTGQLTRQLTGKRTGQLALLRYKWNRIAIK